MEFNAAVIMLSLQLNIPYKCIVNTKSSKRCNACPECPNNMKFSPQSNFSVNISILVFISAENEDKRSIKNARIGEFQQYYKKEVVICPVTETNELRLFVHEFRFF